MVDASLVDAIAGYRASVERRYPSYAVLLPGDPSFACDAEACNARCCRSLTVPVAASDVVALAQETGLPETRFLEEEDGRAIHLPLSDPFVLRRREGACIFLEGSRCQAYAGRPKACRSYPFDLAVIDPGDGRETRAGGERNRTVPAGAAGPIPVLLRHRDCPGFTGPPMTADEWAHLLEELADLRGRSAGG